MDAAQLLCMCACMCACVCLSAVHAKHVSVDSAPRAPPLPLAPLLQSETCATFLHFQPLRLPPPHTRTLCIPTRARSPTGTDVRVHTHIQHGHPALIRCRHCRPPRRRRKTSAPTRRRLSGSSCTRTRSRRRNPHSARHPATSGPPSLVCNNHCLSHHVDGPRHSLAHHFGPGPLASAY